MTGSLIAATGIRLIPRALLAVLCGIVAGVLIPSSLQVGLLYHFPAEQGEGWGFLLWREHWALRVVASVLSAAGAGLIAGVVARRWGWQVGALATLPATVAWLWVAITAWAGTMPFFGSELHISLGNRIAATLLTAVLLPIGAATAALGADLGADIGPHFDTRPHTLLGIRWYHYLWLPLLIHLYLAQTAWAGYYGLGWAMTAWKAGDSLFSFLPFLFTVAIWSTFVLLGTGLVRAYAVLAGLEVADGDGRTWSLVKYGLGYPLAAAALQTAIMFVHYGLMKVFQ